MYQIVNNRFISRIDWSGDAEGIALKIWVTFHPLVLAEVNEKGYQFTGFYFRPYLGWALFTCLGFPVAIPIEVWQFSSKDGINARKLQFEVIVVHQEGRNYRAVYPLDTFETQQIQQILSKQLERYTTTTDLLADLNTIENIVSASFMFITAGQLRWWRSLGQTDPLRGGPWWSRP